MGFNSGFKGLRTSGAIIHRPLYAFMTWTRTTLPLPLPSPYPQRSQPIRQVWRPDWRARMGTTMSGTVDLNSGAMHWRRVENLLFNCLLVKVTRTVKSKKGERQTMLYLTDENVSPSSRTTGVSQVISCFKSRGNAIVFTSIKLQFTNWPVYCNDVEH